MACGKITLVGRVDITELGEVTLLYFEGDDAQNQVISKVSGLHKSLRGLEKITSGTLEIGGRVVNNVPPAQRGIAMVFQSYALYPHMTVREKCRLH